MHGDLDHGSDQRGRHTVTADVCYQKTNLGETPLAVVGNYQKSSSASFSVRFVIS
jgi:hypothetical protein